MTAIFFICFIKVFLVFHDNVKSLMTGSDWKVLNFIPYFFNSSDFIFILDAFMVKEHTDNMF